MSNEFIDHEPSANPTAKPAAAMAHWLYAGSAFAAALFLFISIPFQTTFFEGVVWSKQPATWPTIAIIGMVISGLGHFLLLRKAIWPPNPLPFRDDIMLLVRSFELSGWFVVYIYAVGYLGYLPSSLVFALFLCWRQGFRQFRHFVIIAFTAMGIVILFKAFLKVKIPGGALYGVMPDIIARFFNTYL